MIYGNIHELSYGYWLRSPFLHNSYTSYAISYSMCKFVGYLDNRYNLQRRTTGKRTLHQGTDRLHIRTPPQTQRTKRNHPGIRVLPIHQKGPRSTSKMPRPGIRIPKSHQLDQSNQIRPGTGKEIRGNRDRHTLQPIRLPHLLQVQMDTRENHKKPSLYRTGIPEKRDYPPMPYRGRPGEDHQKQDSSL